MSESRKECAMASTQKQKTVFGGSVAGSLSARWPGSAEIFA